MPDATDHSGIPARSDHTSDHDNDSDASHVCWLDDDEVIHREGRALFAARPARHWKFLSKWFTRIAPRVLFSDPERADSHSVRIGRELDDLWLDVRVEDGSTIGYRGLGRHDEVDTVRCGQHLRRAREALLLLSALARVDYPSWIGGMVRKAGLRVPKHLELRHCPELPRAFCFFFNSDLSPVYYQWDLLQHLLGDNADAFSQQFTDDFATLREVARRSGRSDVEWCDTIPIKLALEPEGTEGVDIENEVLILRGITETVRALLAINERNHHGGGGRVHSIFQLEGVKLNLCGFAAHPSVFDAIRELLETGVPVKIRKLPDHVVEDDVDQTTLRVAWTELVVTAMGHRVVERGQPPVQLDELDVSGRYFTSLYMIPLCSALRDTQVLKSLSLDFTTFGQATAATQRRLWQWLDYALFSTTPTNTIHTLGLEFLRLASTVHGELARGDDTTDPVGDMWKTVTPQRDHVDMLPTPRRSVLIASGTTLTVRGVQGRAPKLQTASAYKGVLIRDQVNKPTVDVLISGLGFCRVPREHVLPCDSIPVEHAVGEQIKTLVIQVIHNPRRDGAGQEYVTLMRTFMERLLRFVGPSLTALSVGCDLPDGVDIQGISRLCPNLQSLRLRGFVLGSLDVITSLYQAPTNCTISSLDLSHLQVPIDAFENFLAVLTPEDGRHPIQKTLERLRIGRGYSGTFRRATENAMTCLLRYNSKLTHVIVFQKEPRHAHPQQGGGIFDDSDSEDRSDDDEDGTDGRHRHWRLPSYFNGQLLPEFPLAYARRTAFLSVVRELSRQNRAGGDLGSDLIQLIFALAADRVWRRAYTERDVDSEMMDYMRQVMPQFLV